MVDRRYTQYAPPIQQGLLPPSVPNMIPERVALQSTFAMFNRIVIDEFQHKSWFYLNLPKKDLIDGVNRNGASLQYTFWRAEGTPSAYFREFNSSVTPTYGENSSETTVIGNLASAVAIDKDLKRFGGVVDQWQAQVARCKQGLADLFNETVIRGNSSVPRDPTQEDRAVGPSSFDGLDRIIRRIGWHVWPEPIDLTGLGDTSRKLENGQNVNSSNIWIDVVDAFMTRINLLYPRPTFILGNTHLISALSSLAERTGAWNSYTDNFGHTINTIRGISLIDMGKRAGKPGVDIIPTEKTQEVASRDNPDMANYTYVTKAYVGSFGEAGIMGLKLPGNEVEMMPPVTINNGWGELYNVQMFIGMVVQNRNSVGLFDNICLPKHMIEFPGYVDTRVAPIDDVDAAA